MLLAANLFYRKYGVRTLSQLMSPPYNQLESLSLPQRSIYHYVTYDGIEDGPANDDYLLRAVKMPVSVMHVQDMTSFEGAPKTQTFNAMELIRNYHATHRKTRRMLGLESALRDPQTPMVVNYCPINKHYRYIRNVFSSYYRWKNTFKTVIDTIADLVQKVESNHYLVTSAPKLLPSVTNLNDASKEMTQQLMKYFRGSESFLLLDFWMWLGADRQKSILSAIPINKLHLVNFVFQDFGRWFVINLGVLNSFRRPDQTDQVPFYKSSSPVDPIQLQKRWLKAMMSVMETRVLSVAPAVGETKNDSPQVEDEDGQQLMDDVADILGSDADEETVRRARPVEEMLVGTPADNLEASDQVEDEETSETEEERQARLKKEDEIIESDLARLNEIVISRDDSKVAGTIAEVRDAPRPSLEEAVTSLCDRLANDAVLSPADHRRFTKLATMYQSIPSPEGKGTLADFKEVRQEHIALDLDTPTIPDSDMVFDKTMLYSSISQMDEKYASKVLKRHVVNAVLDVQHAGIAVTGYSTEQIENVLGKFEKHTVKLAPVIGQPSTVSFILPVVEADGTFKANGVRYRLRRQKVDMPIRKVSPTRVGITSAYGKVFINRARKKAHDYAAWLQGQINLKSLVENPTVTNVSYINVFDPTKEYPRAYSSIAMKFAKMNVAGFELNFNHADVLKQYPENILKKYEYDGSVVFGKSEQGTYLVMDKNSAVHVADANKMTLRGTIESLFGLNQEDSPVDFCELTVFGKDIPVGVVLAYYMGLDQLIKSLGVEYRRVPAGQRLNLQPHEYALQFSDESLIFSREDRLASLILGGFLEYHRAIRLFSVYSFDQRGVYLNLLEAAGLTVRYLREIDNLDALFVNTVTADILKSVKEPVTFRGLLVRACELLSTDAHSRMFQGSQMRYKGYERLADAVYGELTDAIRQHNGKQGKQNAKIEIKPYAVFRRIAEDPSKMQINEINPIRSLKEIEAVTFSGTGGRSRQSMVKNTRAYDPEDMGIVSESTVDSSDVGINVFTSANPQFVNVLGVTRRYDEEKVGMAGLLSTSSMLSPAVLFDDPKRANFIAIQQEHTVACDGYHQAQIRTGYESVMPHRTGDLFCITAKKPGVVTSVQPNAGIMVRYDDGEIVGYQIGRRFGNSAGLTLPHEVRTELKAGDRFEVSDCIIYNTGFFEADFFDKKKIVYKNTTNATMVLWESHQTLEDSSSISKRLSAALKTKITKVKNIVLRFDQAISSVKRVGEKVTAETVLCIIEDSVTANAGLFSEASLETLRMIGNQAPKAGVKGVIEKIEVFYHGEKEDMGDSVRALADYGDEQLRIEAHSQGKRAFTGLVDPSFRIDNNPLSLDSLAIRYYITQDVGAGVGDKGVFSSQLKTVFGEVLDEDYVTEDGQTLDGCFGAKSIQDRIVASADIIGTSAAILNRLAKIAASSWKRNKRR